jgi:hypothetical protein
MRRLHGYLVNPNGSSDPTQVCREVFNPYSFEIKFVSLRPWIADLKDSVIVAHSRARIFLPHGYYSIYVKGVAHLNLPLLVCFGDAIDASIFPTAEQEREFKFVERKLLASTSSLFHHVD